MQKEFCPCCGQSVSKHKHSLSANMVKILKKAATRFPFVEFHLQKDIELTHSQYANFQKLRYWGLADKGDTSGHWRITSHGRGFLAGEISLPRWVKTFNNSVVEQSSEYVSVRDSGELPIRYKQRSEYAKDAEPMFEESLF